MTTTTEPSSQLSPWRLLWLALPVPLTIPLLLQWPWSGGDYIFAAVLFGAAGALVELAAWASGSAHYRGGAILAVLASVALIWVNGAVGIIGDEGNPANLLFLGVIAIAALGALLSGFKARGISLAMTAAAVAQTIVCAVGYAARWGSAGAAGLYEAMLGIVLFVPLWAGAAWLFARAARPSPI